MFGVTTKAASDQDWGLEELGEMGRDLVWEEVSSPLTLVSSTCTSVGVGACCLCSTALGRGSLRSPVLGYINCRGWTHRHIVKFIVRNSLFHQVWLLCGP